MTVLITGANGTVSSTLLRSLRTIPGVKLRALVRDARKAPDLPGVQFVIGDLDHPASLTEAFTGVDTVWLLNAMGPQAPHASMNALWAARHAGATHIVRMSAVGAAHDAPTRNGRLHALSDRELMDSGTAWTIVRPHFFMQNVLGSFSGDTLYAPLGDGRLAMVDVRDIADFAARVLVEPQAHAGRIYTLTGPASLSLHDAATALTGVVGAAVTYESVAPPDAVAAMIDAGFPHWVAEVSAEYGIAYARGWGDFTTSDFSDVMGRPPRAFADFARDHADHLRPA